MKRILYIAPEAFPVMTSESICNSKVAYALASAGYKIDVFTCDDRETYPEDNRIDSHLRNHPNLTIYSIKNTKKLVSRTYGFIQVLSNIFLNLGILLKTGYWYNGISIPYFIYKAIEKKVAEWGEFPYDIIITRATYCDLAAILLKKKYKVRWNANWNDPFPDKKFPEPYGRGYNTKLPYFENKIYTAVQKMVDLHTFPSDRLRKYQLKCFPLVEESKTCVIPHMAHSELLPIVKQKKSENKTLKIVHCGSVSKPRNPDIFIKALSNVVKQRSLTAENLQCYFVGRYDPDLDSKVKSLNLDNIVKLLPPQTYSDSLSFISTCNISLIIEAQCEEGIYLPTKFVDAMQTDIPVFCVSPLDGTLRDMVEEYNVGYICDNTSEEDVERAMNTLFDEYEANNLPEVNKQKASYFYEDSVIKIFKDFI